MYGMALFTRMHLEKKISWSVLDSAYLLIWRLEVRSMSKSSIHKLLAVAFLAIDIFPTKHISF